MDELKLIVEDANKKCPNCNSENSQLNKLVMGPFLVREVFCFWFVCQECGIHFSDVTNKK